MSKNLSHFGLCIDVPYIDSASRSFRPPSWPPPKDWVCIEDAEGNPVSFYGDSIWHFYPWVGRTTSFHFGDGPQFSSRTPVIDPANAELLRQLVAWRAWGPRGSYTVSNLLSNFAFPIRKIIAICSANNILASNLSRYPAVIDRVAQALAPSQYEIVIAELERLRDVREFLGFELLDVEGIQQLKATKPIYSGRQTEYIPPRIWIYVVNRVSECINDFLVHQEKIEACFEFCVKAYEQNDVCNNRKKSGSTYRNPFRIAPNGRIGQYCGRACHGPFADMAHVFGIKDLIEKWVGRIYEQRGVRGLISYFQLIQCVTLVKITAFTLMRIEEAASVRWNSLLWHDDPVYGRIPLIQAKTTKTDPDNNALWITSPSVEPAIRALKIITKIRLSSVGRWSEEDNPNLITAVLEPWGGGRKTSKRLGVKPYIRSLNECVCKFPLLFDPQQLTITKDDFKIAKNVCPTLNAELFQVGIVWHLAWHQFRRTGAVNMFASGDISDSSLQLQLKHLTRLMSLYYGRGNTALHLNDAARILLVNAQYEAMGRQLAEVHTNRFVSPYGDEHKARLLAPANGGEPVNLISEGDAQHYEKAARKQLLNFRRTSLGGCMKNGQCDGDCISSVGDCAGGNGKAPCVNVLFDCTRAEVNQILLEGVIKQLESTVPDTPRYRFLEQEMRGLENYFAYIRKEV